MYKTCTKCKQSLLMVEFSRDNKRKDKLQPICKACGKQYTIENRERILENKRKFWTDNKIRLSEKNKIKYLQNKERYTKQIRDYYSTPENRKKKILSKTKERARDLGIEFNLTVDDIVIPTHCPYLGIELTHSLGKGQLYSNSSIDRINPTKGYIKGNVEIISRKANTMKSNATPEELVEFSKNVLMRYSPGLVGTTLQKYAEAIKEYANNI